MVYSIIATLVLITIVFVHYIADSPIKEDVFKYTYNAAVVEFALVTNNSLSNLEKLTLATKQYLELIDSVNDDLDIIVFPESALIPLAMEDFYTWVPEPFDEIICGSNNTKYKEFLKEFSCAAIKYNTTIVINLTEKYCVVQNVSGVCSSSDIVYYNTNVAFGNNGMVSGRYRKWNLFDKHVSRPPTPELVIIRTKNDDEFGIFTCFDILFRIPSLELVRKLKLRNIIFPSRWLSEIPYLTALQVQQMWAHENNVNLLSSGSSNPQAASGGSSINIGDRGSIAREQSDSPGKTKLLVKRLPRLEIENNPYIHFDPVEEDVDALAKKMDNFDLWVDNTVYEYSSVLVDYSKTDIVETVCNGESIRLCCEFNIQLSIDKDVDIKNKVQYTYHLVSFNGVKNFSGFMNGGIESCGVIACLNDSVASCGRRFSNYSEISWPITFQTISIAADFPIDENRIQFPNSLLASIRPIPPQFTTWTKNKRDDKIRRTHILNKPQNRLLTFGIFGRVFSRDKLGVFHPS